MEVSEVKEEQDIEKTQKQEALLSWLKGPHALFILVMLFAFFVRLYYFSLTLNQPLWWDEASYMAAAKYYAGIGSFQLESIRLPGFPLTMSLFFFLGITNEAILRFFGLFIPSLIVIILTYFMITEMYADKRIAVISTLIITVLWEHLFYSNRFHTENFALIFEFLALIIFIRSYVKNKSFFKLNPKYALLLVFACAFLSIMYRPGNILFIPAIILFIPLLYTKQIPTNKKLRVFSFIAILLLIGGAFFLLSYVKNPIIKQYIHFDQPLAWNTLTAFYGFYQSYLPLIPSLFYYAFLIGIVLFIANVYIYLPRIKEFKKDAENLELKSDILNALILFSVLFSFIFLIRSPGFEYRWLFPLLPGMLVFTSKGVISFSEYIGKSFKNKKTTSVLIILIVALGIFTQFAHVDPLIKLKSTTYAPVKESGLWIKENTLPSDIIFSTSFPQIAYYSEREIINYNGMNETQFESFIEANKPKYLIVSVFETSPPWINEWLQRNQNRLNVEQAYFADEQRQQAVLIVYEIVYPQSSIQNRTNVNTS